MHYKYGLLLVLAVFTVDSYANGRQVEYLWRPDNLDASVSPVDVSFDDAGHAITTIRTTDGITASYKQFRCTGGDGPIYAANVDRVIYTALPKEVKLANGLYMSIGQGYGSNVNKESNVPEGYTATYSSYRESVNFGWRVPLRCPTSETDETRVVPVPSTTINIPVSVNLSGAIPGTYTGVIEGRMGIYENFCRRYDYCGNGTLAQQWFTFPGNLPLRIPYTVHVMSKCAFNRAAINLSHGYVSADQAEGNQTRPYDINITCNTDVSATVKLTGSESVPGKTGNYTPCGKGGVCELTFDDGKYDELIQIDRARTLSLKSTYHLKDPQHPVAGPFDGSAVLQISIK